MNAVAVTPTLFASQRFDHGQLTGAGVTEHVSLSTFLAPLSTAIKSVAVSTWVAAEISEISDRNHVYITLIESDDSGSKIAELRVSIWASGKQKLLDRFSEGTGGEKLRKGLKVLLKLKPSLHALYGLTATVEGIDPAFTLGDAARKLQELRKRLVEEGAYDRQRLFPVPTDFTRLAVICPAAAAGLGDFQSHADPLQAARLCEFIYWNATFQGERTSGEVVAALRAVYSAHRAQPFDAVIILRGGGAQSDLAWLNDYEIGNAISKMPLPVLVAIGHERGWRLLTRDRAYLGHQITADGVESVIEVIHAAAANDVAAVETDIDGQRSLIRDRSFLAVRTIQDRVKASAEFVLGLGPEKTLQRGFVMASRRRGRISLGSGNTWHCNSQTDRPML